MTNQKDPHPCPGLVDKTIANMDELLNANKTLVSGPGLPAHTEIEKQRLYIEASMSRCRRCGDFAPAFPVAGILLRLCSDCETHLQKRDGVMWFAHMVAAISQKGKKS